MKKSEDANAKNMAAIARLRARFKKEKEEEEKIDGLFTKQEYL